MKRESYSELFELRYGRQPEHVTTQFAGPLSHRSIRSYDDRPIPDGLKEGLIACAQSAATSSNLQLWSVVEVNEQREEITRLTGNQNQVRTAPWFLAFVADLNRIYQAGDGQEMPALEFAEFYTMAVVDASLAAERMVCASEHYGLGICYIGGLRNHVKEVKDLLGLPERTFPLFGLCLGYPDPEVKGEVKPRLAQENIWFKEKYGSVDTTEYDERMRTFYESQEMKGDFTWSMRSAKRSCLDALGTRDDHLEFLHAQGLLKR